MMRFVKYMVFATACAWAQEHGALDISGTVTEPGTNLPVAGASVTLYEFVEIQKHLSVRRVYATTGTDVGGTFQFHAERFGDYFLDVKKEGYAPATVGGPGEINADAGEFAVSLRGDQSSQSVKFYLMRPGELSGRVLDEDGEPVVGLRVSAQANVALPEFQQQSAITDMKGSFTISNLVPDRYLIRISPKTGDSETVMTRFSKDDLKVVDQDLALFYWPGGSDLQAASPIPVSPGGSISLGTITVRKASYFRAHVTVVADDCGPSEGWQFSAITATSLPHFTGVSCAKEFLVRNLRPGSYWFTLSNGQDGEESRQGLVPVEIDRENVEVKLTMAPGTTGNGQLPLAGR